MTLLSSNELASPQRGGGSHRQIQQGLEQREEASETLRCLCWTISIPSTSTAITPHTHWEPYLGSCVIILSLNRQTPRSMNEQTRARQLSSTLKPFPGPGSGSRQSYFTQILLPIFPTNRGGKYVALTCREGQDKCNSFSEAQWAQWFTSKWIFLHGDRETSEKHVSLSIHLSSLDVPEFSQCSKG